MYDPFNNNPNTLGTVHFWLLPFIEQDNLFKQANGYIYNNPPNAHTKPMVLYRCPSDPSDKYEGLLDPGNPWATTSYAANYQVFGNPDAGDYPADNMNGKARFPASFQDGQSNTIMFTERYQGGGGSCGGFGCLWGHGNWENGWMPMFAYGNRTGTQGYTSFYNWAGPGKVGVASLFQLQPRLYNQVPMLRSQPAAIAPHRRHQRRLGRRLGPLRQRRHFRHHLVVCNHSQRQRQSRSRLVNAARALPGFVAPQALRRLVQ